jgi:hypothetical protein
MVFLGKGDGRPAMCLIDSGLCASCYMLEILDYGICSTFWSGPLSSQPSRAYSSLLLLADDYVP